MAIFLIATACASDPSGNDPDGEDAEPRPSPRIRSRLAQEQISRRVTSYDYDGDQLVTMTDERLDANEFRKVRTLEWDGQVPRAAHDVRGSGTTLDIEFFFENGKLARSVHADEAEDGEVTAFEVSYSYDGDGNILLVERTSDQLPTLTTSFTYDGGRLLTATSSFVGGNLSYYNSIVLDWSEGRLVSIEQYGGAGDEPDEVVTVLYDDEGRLQQLVESDGGGTTMFYEEDGRLAATGRENVTAEFDIEDGIGSGINFLFELGVAGLFDINGNGHQTPDPFEYPMRLAFNGGDGPW